MIVTIYTDGSCKGNPGIGGWGAIMECNGRTKSIFGGEIDTTNNRMELTAAIKALEALNKPCSVTIHSDSAYVVEGASKWLERWVNNGWKGAKNKPIKNKDLWEGLSKAVVPHNVKWVWVKGHSGIQGNEMADMLANRGAESAVKS